MTAFFRKAGSFFASLLGCHSFKCISCGAEVYKKGNAFCDKCGASVRYNEDKTCKKCGKPSNHDICEDCVRRKPAFDRAWSSLQYEGAVRTAMLAYKFGGYSYIAKHFASYMAQKATDITEPFDIVTFVPLTKSDFSARGYNQTQLLADNFCDILGLKEPVSLLEKTRQTEKQEQLGLNQRIINLKGAFLSVPLNGQRVLLIDDVLTTGATCSECAYTLKQAGAAAVYVLTAAAKAGEDSTRIKGENHNNVK